MLIAHFEPKPLTVQSVSISIIGSKGANEFISIVELKSQSMHCEFSWFLEDAFRDSLCVV